MKKDAAIYDAYSEPCQTSKIKFYELFWKQAPSQMFDKVLNTPLNLFSCFGKVAAFADISSSSVIFYLSLRKCFIENCRKNGRVAIMKKPHEKNMNISCSKNSLPRT